MMKKDFIKYKVKSNDSLSSIAFRMNMNKHDLKEFHNQNCGKMDKLWFESLRGVEFILIPIDYVSKEEQEDQLQKRLPSVQDLVLFHAGEYNITENIQELNKDQLEFNYKVNIEIEQKTTQIIAKTRQKNFKKNNCTPDDKVSSLALACMETVSPIPFIISPHGKISSFAGHKTLVQNFKDNQTAIRDFFTGAPSKAYIDLFYENISNEKYFLKQISSTLLNEVLFPDINWFSRKSSWVERFKIYHNSFSLKFDFNAEYFHENIEYVETVIKGIIAENCSLHELIKGSRFENEKQEDSINTSIEIHYFTNKFTKQLAEASATICICNRNELFYKHHLNLKTQK
ncbi:LysM peptidoglycan-binding domain-containing protein [Chryseobacterium sp. S0630]|uniref:LysM peptidoglycan-binding domain-containing protein n=1 Tax=Chryseobacterium sp. S0630 TaxID=2957803 RepID=UPI0020A1057B|nr:LysM peptidoglycan-binding domain-containing protein [Chryseobacterium sp. S0630]MCP1298247.1 LysM peptidoglycan-binding domain-containing protein [Chryseobacterium sp. S0630]